PEWLRCAAVATPPAEVPAATGRRVQLFRLAARHHPRLRAGRQFLPGEARSVQPTGGNRALSGALLAQAEPLRRGGAGLTKARAKVTMNSASRPVLLAD